MDTTCMTIISAMATAMVAVVAWGVKQARDKEKILREWLDDSRDQIKILNLVDQVNKNRS